MCGTPTARRAIRYSTASALSVRRSVKADGYRWKNQLSALGHRPVAKIDTPEVQRWLDTISGLGARSHALIQLKSLLRFAASRGLAETHAITITAAPVAANPELPQAG